MATLSIGMAMIGIAGIYQAQSHGQSFPVAVSISPFKDEKYLATAAISGPLPPNANDFQKPESIDLTPAAMAAIFARDMADCELVVGETYTWSEIQIQYRRYAKQHGWRMEIADRILSKALKDVGAVRGQRDLRSTGGGRPITITFPGLGP